MAGSCSSSCAHRRLGSDLPKAAASQPGGSSGSLTEEGAREDSVVMVAPLLALLQRRGPQSSGAAMAGFELPPAAGHGRSCRPHGRCLLGELQEGSGQLTRPHVPPPLFHLSIWTRKRQ